MTWTREKPIETNHIGCLNCGGSDVVLSMNTIIAAGFGYAYLTKNGEEVFNSSSLEYENCMSVNDAELLATEDPDNDWRIGFVLPLREAYYQRQDGVWILYKEGSGFA